MTFPLLILNNRVSWLYIAIVLTPRFMKKRLTRLGKLAREIEEAIRVLEKYAEEKR